MEKEDPPQKRFLLDQSVYKSTLVYRPSDYYDNITPKYNYYDEYYGEDLEAQKKEEQRAILADGAAAKRAKRRRTCSLCCCSVCYFLFILLLALAIVVIKLIPKDPAVSVGDIKITQFVFNQTGTQQQVEKLQAGLSCGLNVTNRNPHATTIYQEIDLTLFYKNESLGNFSVSAPGPQFEQKRKAMTQLVEDLPTTTTTIGSANAAALTTEVANSNVQVDVTGRVKGQMKVLGMKVKKFDVTVDCKLNVSPGDGGSKKGTVLSLSCYFEN
ncbi:unnamed protein product [Calypogeia fissa]